MWYKTTEEIFKQLRTNINGLTEEEAQKRLIENGANKIPTAKKRTILKMIIDQINNPIIYILLFGAIFSIITNSIADAIFIFVVITINTVIGTYQEWSSEKSAEKLQNMIKIKTRVIRDGILKEINSEDVVVGDIIDLETGAKVPADIRLIETKNLDIDESILTGESIPKSKNTDLLIRNTELAERKNIAFAGSVITKGRGKGIAIATGIETEFGRIAENVILSEDTETPLINKLKKFSKQISIGFILFAIMTSIILYYKGYTISEILSSVVALTVSTIPEGLTIACTIILSIASNKMAKKHVIVKKLSSVESLGSCNVIATDKTGTLTANEQTAKKILLPNNQIADVKGIGYNDIGEIRYDEKNKNQIEEIIKMGYINNDASLKYEDKQWKHTGDAIDIAFLALGLKVPIEEVPQINAIIHYESQLKYSAISYKENNKNYITVKGAPERILDFFFFINLDGKEEEINKALILKQNTELAKEGYRVIAIAKSSNKNILDTSKNNSEENINIKEKELYPKKDDSKINSEIKELHEKDIYDLVFLGLVAFVDPIREGVEEAVKKCKEAGIETIMITGDQKNTAQAIAKRIGINKVYSRVTPMEKLQIVKDLKKEGKLVAVTGDGVNDAPALKSADIGVAMGSGTDIAKETGKMIITDDNFSSIVKGVEEGRRAYNNIRKVIYLLLSTGFSEIILFVLAIIFNLPIPLVAIQLLWLNLISNGVQSNALAFEKDVENVMNKNLNNKVIFNKLMVSEILISAFLMAIIEFIFYLYLYKIKNLEIETIRAYLLTLMVLMENIHIFNCRSERISMVKISGHNNPFLIFTILITCLIQLAIVTTPSLANILHLGVISIESVGFLLLLVLPLMIIMEIFKIFLRKNDKYICSY